MATFSPTATNVQTSQSADRVDFGTKETFALMQNFAENIRQFDRIDDALTIVRSLPNVMAKQPDLITTQPEVFRGYQSLLVLMRAVALSRLTQEEIIAYFRQGIAEALRQPELDIIEKLTAKLVTIFFVEERNQFKADLRAALRQNNERLTTQNFRQTQGGIAGGNTAPTVSQWLLHAEGARVKDDTYLDAIDLDPSYHELNDNESRFVERLMVLEDFLLIDSATPAGIEEAFTYTDPEGRLMVSERGTSHPAVDDQTEKLFRKYFPNLVKSEGEEIATTELKDALVDSYIGTQNHQQDLNVALKAIVARQKQDGSDVMNILNEAVQADRHMDVVATLFLLARGRRLGKFLSDKDFRSKLTRDAVATENPRVLLKNILDRAAGNTDESAQLGAQLASLLVAQGERDYLGMVVFSQASGKYEWRV